jgi:hypothetical protein
MKKFFAILLSIIMVLTMALSVSAAQFVPSITNKGAPDLIVIDRINGKDVVGFITNPDGEQISPVYIDCFEIYSVADALNGAEIPTDAKDDLKKVYEDLSKSDTKISDVCPELDDVVKNGWGKDKTPDDLVVKDLFYIKQICTHDLHKLENGNTVDLTFKVSIDAGVFITAMVYIDGKWVPVNNCVNNGDGTVTVTFSQICPVAFLVPGNSVVDGETVSPATSDVSGVITWSIVMVASLAAIAFLVIYRRRVNG